MTADELLARLDYLGASVIFTGDRPSLAFPPGTPLAGLREELAPALAEHRSSILERYNRDYDGFTCPECLAAVFTRDAGDIFRMCGRPLCPSWKPGLASAPEWIARHRSYELWKRGQTKQQERRDAEGIPD